MEDTLWQTFVKRLARTTLYLDMASPIIPGYHFLQKMRCLKTKSLSFRSFLEIGLTAFDPGLILLYVLPLQFTRWYKYVDF